MIKDRPEPIVPFSILNPFSIQHSKFDLDPPSPLEKGGPEME